jgi:hypothetical protein
MPQKLKTSNRISDWYPLTLPFSLVLRIALKIKRKSHPLTRGSEAGFDTNKKTNDRFHQ